MDGEILSATFILMLGNSVLVRRNYSIVATVVASSMTAGSRVRSKKKLKQQYWFMVRSPYMIATTATPSQHAMNVSYSQRL